MITNWKILHTISKWSPFNLNTYSFKDFERNYQTSNSFYLVHKSKSHDNFFQIAKTIRNPALYKATRFPCLQSCYDFHYLFKMMNEIISSIRWNNDKNNEKLCSDGKWYACNKTKMLSRILMIRIFSKIQATGNANWFRNLYHFTNRQSIEPRMYKYQTNWVHLSCAL